MEGGRERREGGRRRMERGWEGGVWKIASLVYFTQLEVNMIIKVIRVTVI